MPFNFSCLKKPTAHFCLAVLIVGSSHAPAAPSDSPDDLLNRVQKQAFEFLWHEANPFNGLVKDRAGNFAKDNYTVASTASVGFALAAVPVGVERRWVKKAEARERVVRSLAFYADQAEQVNGFFYHFLSMNTGKRAWKSEISSIDSALLLAGALVAREYFNDSEITQLTNKIYSRMDFEWMMDGGKTLSMGWKPETGFLKSRWSQYNEGILLTLLAIGAERFPVPPETWDAIKRPKGEYRGIAVIQSPPLFTHQYPQLFFDLRSKHDAYADYFENSIQATKANCAYCSLAAPYCKTYQKGCWGITASDGPRGYKAYGAEPGGALSDGTVAPTAAITSIMFTPELSIDFLKDLYQNERDWLWGRYGFTDSFNLNPKWRSPDVIGIDQGAILLGIENYRTGLIWKLFSKAPEAQRALALAKFQPGSRKIELLPPPRYGVVKTKNGKNWGPELDLTQQKFVENGEITSPEDLSAKIQFAWDERYLYFRLRVQDDSLVSRKSGEYIWLNDCLEMFVDPVGDGLEWGNARYFQLGFSPAEDLKRVKSWSWFNKEDPVRKNQAEIALRPQDSGYEMIGKVKWNYLRIKPRPGLTLSVTPAFHDMDEDGSDSKLIWYYVSKNGRFELGKLILE